MFEKETDDAMRSSVAWWYADWRGGRWETQMRMLIQDGHEVRRI